MRILVTSDRPDTLERAADYTALFADPRETDITLMRLCEEESRSEEERRQFEALRGAFTEKLGCPVETKLRRGDPIEQILNETEQRDYDLVVLGIHLRPRWSCLRPKLVARRVVRHIQTPLLIVFPEWSRLHRILICTSATRKDSPLLQKAGRLALLAGADVTVLHVMSQIPLSADAQLKDLERNVDELIEHDSREGIHLERALETLAQVGVPAGRSEAKIKRGLVVDEIVRESEEGNFDLVVLGAHHVPPERSWHELRELIQEDIAERVLVEASRPVLIIPVRRTAFAAPEVEQDEVSDRRRSESVC